MQIQLNGELQTISFQTLNELVQHLNLEGKRFAIELNEMIVPKHKFANTLIQENDRIEVIQAVGGG